MTYCVSMLLDYGLVFLADSRPSAGVDVSATFIVGGQIMGEPPRLFQVYAAGNFIEATPDTTCFRIGESKYGKPIIGRVTRRGMALAEAAKCALISMDSTIRSNLTVGLPLDLVIMRPTATLRTSAMVARS